MGVSNTYLVRACDPLAVTYNDVSVLENFHAAEGFRVMGIRSCNILAGLQPDEYKHFRQLTLKVVLATDLAYSYEYITKFNTYANTARGRKASMAQDRSEKIQASPEIVKADTFRPSFHLLPLAAPSPFNAAGITCRAKYCLCRSLLRWPTCRTRASRGRPTDGGRTSSTRSFTAKATWNRARGLPSAPCAAGPTFSWPRASATSSRTWCGRAPRCLANFVASRCGSTHSRPTAASGNGSATAASKIE
ncbi:unnamed protein product [Phaeothamnion confervicola]